MVLTFELRQVMLAALSGSYPFGSTLTAKTGAFPERSAILILCISLCIIVSYSLSNCGSFSRLRKASSGFANSAHPPAKSSDGHWKLAAQTEADVC